MTLLSSLLLLCFVLLYHLCYVVMNVCFISLLIPELWKKILLMGCLHILCSYGLTALFIASFTPIPTQNRKYRYIANKGDDELAEAYRRRRAIFNKSLDIQDGEVLAVENEPNITQMGFNFGQDLPKRHLLPYNCDICHMLKGDRTHHCKTCGVCVRKMDHHCPVLGRCVDASNHLNTFQFAAATSLLISWGLWLTVPYQWLVYSILSNLPHRDSEAESIMIVGLVFQIVSYLMMLHMSLPIATGTFIAACHGLSQIDKKNLYTRRRDNLVLSWGKGSWFENVVQCFGKDISAYVWPKEIILDEIIEENPYLVQEVHIIDDGGASNEKQN